MSKLKSFETLLREGAVFDVPESGPWILETQDGKEICRGNSLEEMIENSPSEDCVEFSEVPVGKLFTYLGEEYYKTPGFGLRTSDQFQWRFRGNEQVFIK